MNESGNIDESCAVAVPADGYVYMLYSQGLVKIGFTTDPMLRFDKLRSMSAVPMSMVWLAHGSKLIERKLHKGFAADRAHGEWFRPSQAIRSFLAGRPNTTGWPPLKRLEWAEANPTKMLGP